MLAVAWPFGPPALFTDTGGSQTRGAMPKGSNNARLFSGVGCPARPCHNAKKSKDGK
jgi:hypothetical protein